MATVRILLAFLCFALVGVHHVHSRHLLSFPGSPLIAIARKELGVREKTGKNDGQRVNLYQAAAGLTTGAPWCAAFISWVYQQAGFKQPATGWSPALFPIAKVIKTARPGALFGIYFPAHKRIAHCGFVEEVRGDWISTIEGNTNAVGSREGDGVYRKWRPLKSIRRFADWRIQHE